MNLGMNPEAYLLFSIRQSLTSCQYINWFQNQGNMTPWRFFSILCILVLGQASMASTRQGPVSLPFSLVNNLILIPVQINGSDTLQFIFDTGLENSIICELGTDETLELMDAREVLVRGLGSGNPIDAIQSSGNNLRVGDISIQDQDYLILASNVLQVSLKMGTKIHGLLNMKAFQDYIVEIDYDRQLLTFYQSCYFREHKNLDGYTTLEMDLINSKPYISATIFTNDTSSRLVKLMLDTGAGNALSLDTGSMPGYALPEGSRDGYLGYSIHGQIEGKIGRITGIDIGPYHLKDVLVSYPDSMTDVIDEQPGGHHGSLGAAFLRRFNLILDGPGNKIHIAANSAFDDEFHFNMSGLELLVPVPDEHRYIIAGTRKQSGAERAGILPGDEILSINGIPAVQLSLDEIYHYLMGYNGRKIKLELIREGKKTRANFQLKKYI